MELDKLKYFIDNILEHKSFSVQLIASVLAIKNQYRADDAKKTIKKIRKINIKEGVIQIPCIL